MTNQQINPEAAVDRVLTGLAGVEASPEIEQRVLQAVQRRTAEQERPRFAALSTFTHWRPWAIAACVVVLSVAASVAVRKQHEPRHEDAVLNQHTSPKAAVAPPTEVTEVQPRQPAYSASPRRKKPEILSDEEALAISEMNAPSKPAPPMPLTEQERLLLKLLHRGDRIQLAMLDPKISNWELASSRAQFEQFFATPKVDEMKPETERAKPATGDTK